MTARWWLDVRTSDGTVRLTLGPSFDFQDLYIRQHSGAEHCPAQRVAGPGCFCQLRSSDGKAIGNRLPGEPSPIPSGFTPEPLPARSPLIPPLATVD